MYIVVIGSGRTGSSLASRLSRQEHDVVIVDREAEKFNNLSIEFSGFKVEGDALEHDILKQANLDQAELAVITTGNDKVNYMLTQMARVSFQVPRVMVRVIDPEKEDMFRNDSGVEPVSPLGLLVDEFSSRIELKD